jgi:hypothetical protein
LDCADGLGFDAIDDDGASAERPAQSPFPMALETELQFFTRRAMEESLLAKHAATPQAAAAHSYLAAAYSAQVAKELARQGELEELLLELN